MQSPASGEQHSSFLLPFSLPLPTVRTLMVRTSDLLQWPRFMREPQNRDLVVPKDYYDFLAYVAVWGVLYFVLRKFVFEPLARKIVPAHTTNGSPELSAAVPVECIKPVGGSASAVRQRKPNGKPGSNSAMKRKPSEVNGRPTSPSRPRRVDDREKFTLSAWKFFMFGISTLVGIYLYRKEGWLLDPKAYWENWGQPGMMSDLVKFYYKLGFSAYAFHSISIFFEPKQKDFAVMVTHHVITLLLIYLSYVWPYFRVGAAILFLHDMSDPFMELAKMALYTGRTKLADYLFGVFAMVFIITRNYIFPVYVIGSIFKYGGEGDHAILYGDFTVRDAATVCLCLLEVLHIFWSSLIVKMAYKALTTGAVGDDTRNDD